MLNKIINICQPFDLYIVMTKQDISYPVVYSYTGKVTEREEFCVMFKTILNLSNYLNQKQDFFLVPVTPKRVMKVYSKLFRYEVFSSLNFL